MTKAAFKTTKADVLASSAAMDTFNKNPILVAKKIIL